MAKNSEETYTMGIDLGGTKVETGLIDSNGKIIFSRKFPTKSYEGTERIISDIIEATKKSQDEIGVEAEALGVGVAGQIDSKGIVRSAPNLPFQEEPLQERLSNVLSIPVTVTNDVRAATYGEWKYGSGKGVDDLVVMYVGTGIGGGVVSGGRLLGGCSNTFGELGHITLVAEGRKCRCPNWGCIEAYAGGWAIAKRAQEAVFENPLEGEMLKTLAGGIKKISAETVSQAYRTGDHLARKLVEETGVYLGAGLVGIVNAFNPCLLVLGGGIIEGIPELLNMVEELIFENALRLNLEKLRIEKSPLGGNAGVIGAAAFALEKIRR
jgi:glucokinase